MRGADKMAIVIQEILQDKIYLDGSGNIQLGGQKARNQTIMANLPGSYPGMPGAAPPMPGSGVRADSED